MELTPQQTNTLIDHVSAWYEAPLGAPSSAAWVSLKAFVASLAHEGDGERKRLEGELERTRMQLVACSTVALANTRESAAKAREMHPEYRCPAVDDVAAAVDREMALREKVDALEASRDAYRRVADAFWEERNHDAACKLVAEMHAAAVGEVCGPRRGVVEDVADLRARCLAAEEALGFADAARADDNGRLNRRIADLEQAVSSLIASREAYAARNVGFLHANNALRRERDDLRNRLELIETACTAHRVQRTDWNTQADEELARAEVSTAGHGDEHDGGAR